MAARQLSARKTTFPQNMLAVVHSSLNHLPFHHIIHLVRNGVAVPRNRAWLALHQFTTSPLCWLEKPERSLCSKLKFVAALGCSAAPGPWAGWQLLLPAVLCASCALSCVCCLPGRCRQSGCSALSAAGCSHALLDYFTWGVSALREGSVMCSNVVKSLPQKEESPDTIS